MSLILDKGTGYLQPNGFKAGTLFGYVPENENTVGVDPASFDFDFARASIGSFINEAGLIENAADNVPRLPFVDGCPVLLLEDAATNYIYPSNISNLSSSGTPVIDEQVNDIDFYSGEARHIVGTGGYYVVAKGVILTTNVHTFSYYTKLISGKYYMRIAGTIANTAGYIRIEPDGSVSSNTSSLTIINSGVETTGHLTRVWFTAAPDKIETLYTSLFYVGVTNGEIYLNDPQIEEGDYITSLIPTTTATVTRAADKCIDAVYTGESNEGVLFVDMAALSNDGSNRVLSISDGTDVNTARIEYTSGNIIRCRLKYGASNILISGAVTDITEPHKAAFRWNGLTTELYIDGAEATNGTSLVIPPSAFNKVNFSEGDVTNPMVAKVSRLSTLPYLTDTEMISITT